MNPRFLLRAASCCCSLGATLVPVFASDPATNLWGFGKHLEPDGSVTIAIQMLDINNPPPDFQGASGDFWKIDLTAPARLMFDAGTNRTIGTRFSAGYYRGLLYTARTSRAPFSPTEASGTNYASIFTTGDRTQLIVAVDRGPIYTSTNSGVAWTIITTPGLHKFPLSTAADGSGIYAYVPQDQPSPSGLSHYTNSPMAGWYAVASSQNGSKLVATASLSQPAPALNIRSSANLVTVAWPAQYTAFVLEHNSNLGAGTWAAVTNAVQVEGAENQVVVPPSIGNDFFRLRTR